MSKQSQNQVQTIIRKVQPNVVMVELDPTRLERIGISSIDSIKNDNNKNTIDRVLTAPEEILLTAATPQQGLSWILQQLFLKGFSVIARKLLTSMYDDMKERQNSIKDGDTDPIADNEIIPGGEFLTAIQEAQICTACHTLVLGDRSSITTIQRAAELAWNSGDAFGVLKRLAEENGKAMEELKERVKVQLGCDENNSTKDDEIRFEMAVIEALKEDSTVREKLFQKLEQNVPEFTQAFLKERDIIMSESIRKEIDQPDVERIVGVVGLAHVKGIQRNLQQS